MNSNFQMIQAVLCTTALCHVYMPKYLEPLVLRKYIIFINLYSQKSILKLIKQGNMLVDAKTGKTFAIKHYVPIKNNFEKHAKF